MTGKVFVVVALVCFIQIAESNIIFGITNATRQKLAEVKKEVAEAERESTVEVNAISNLLERYVDVALIPLEKELKNLKCKIKKAEKSVGDSANIKECINAARRNISKLDREEVRECILANDKNFGASLQPEQNFRPKEIVISQQKLVEFRGLRYVLNQAPNTCANKGILSNTCVLTIINASREKVLILQNEISVILRHTNPEAEGKCISTGVKKLQDKIDDIKDEWTECLQRQQSI